MKMRSHIWFQFHIRTVLSGVPMWIAAFTSLSKTSVPSTCSACSAVLWFHSESKHLLRDKPNPKHSLLVTFWNWTLLYSKFIPQGESVISSICPVASERGYWKNCVNCGAYLHVSMGHFENGGGFWPHKHIFHLPPGQLPTTNLALLQLCSPD